MVLSIITSYLPRKKTDLINSNIEEINNILESIPTTLDKLERYEDLASSILKIDTPMSRHFLKKAMKFTSESSNSEVYSAQKRIIDLAHRIDPDFAASLVSLTDDDPAKMNINDTLKRQLKTLDLRNKMLNSEVNELDEPSSYIQAAWRLLGSLNARRSGAIHIENTHSYLEAASNLPLVEAYPILSWALENAVVRYSNTDHAVTYLRPLFESALQAVDMCLKISTYNRDKLTILKNNIKPDINSSILIMSGERPKAINYIRQWLENELGDYLKVCDPYFGPNDLELLQIIREVKPDCQIHILTSKKHHDSEKIYNSLEEAYGNYWRLNISDQDPPETRITVVGTRNNGVLPIHDRWWLTNSKGLRIGTSFNSLGNRESEISILSLEESSEREIEINKYLSMMTKEFNGDRLIYKTFDFY